MAKIASLLERSYIAIVILVATGSYVLLRSVATLPTVMQDEYVYLSQALSDATNSEFPNFLHSFIYSSVFVFGDDFYLASKVFNIIFAIIFAIAVFAVAKMFVAGWLATVLSATWLLSATSLYSSVFMPEVMYFAFAGLSLFLFLKSLKTERHNASYLFLIASGAALASAALAKPHAVFLGLGLLAFLLIAKTEKRAAGDHALVRMAVFAVAFLFFKLGIGFVLAGTSGLTIFGRSYEQSFVSFISELLSFSRGAESAAGFALNPVEANGLTTFGLFFLVHAVLLLFSFGFMTFGGFYFLLRPANKLHDFQLLVLAISVVYLVLVAAFTALVTFLGDDHSNRILGRYFEFLVPFVLIALFMELSERERVTKSRLAFFVIGLLSSAGVWLFILPNTDFKLADSALMLGAFREPFIPWLFTLVAAALIWLSVSRPLKLIGIAASVITVVTVITGYSAQQRQLDENSGFVAADFAGLSLAKNYDDVPGADIVIIGTNKQLAFVSKFWSKKPGVRDLLLPPGTEISIADPRISAATLIVELPGISIADGIELESRDGYRIIATKTGP